MITTGIVIGKFYPPHKGHEFLFLYASQMVDVLHIIVCVAKTETISGALRAQWIKRMMPGAMVTTIDNHSANDDSEGWAKDTIEHLGFTPDYVFSSEYYGAAYAKFMGSEHVLVDFDRINFSISATEVRANPLSAKSKRMLQPYVRAHFVKRVVLVGAESTGKTTLAKELSYFFNTTFVAEYGREYAEMYSIKENEWETIDFLVIADKQNEREDCMAEQMQQPLLICDTNSFATEIWHERYMGNLSPLVAARSIDRRVDLYILCGDEIPFVQDRQRDGEHIRHSMQQRFIEELTARKLPWLNVSGSKKQRFSQAIQMCKNLLGEYDGIDERYGCNTQAA